MVKNLDVSIFRNGDIIIEAKTDEEWEKAGTELKPVWCYASKDKNMVNFIIGMQSTIKEV